MGHLYHTLHSVQGVLQRNRKYVRAKCSEQIQWKIVSGIKATENMNS